MLVIRMQRTGRKGHAMFRVVVQDSRRTPTSGKVVASLGSYDPHTKVALLSKDKVGFYLEHGAQPSERVAKLLKSEGIKLPSWVSLAKEKSRTVRHPEKLRRNRPAETEAVSEPEATAEPTPDVEEVVPAATEVSEETVNSEKPAEADETPER
jgi:small subunit ribosomal protein S16